MQTIALQRSIQADCLKPTLVVRWTNRGRPIGLPGGEAIRINLTITKENNRVNTHIIGDSNGARADPIPSGTARCW
jgi:hypothetical protein